MKVGLQWTGRFPKERMEQAERLTKLELELETRFEAPIIFLKEDFPWFGSSLPAIDRLQEALVSWERQGELPIYIWPSDAEPPMAHRQYTVMLENEKRNRVLEAGVDDFVSHPMGGEATGIDRG
jgi:hypothetical protein